MCALTRVEEESLAKLAKQSRVDELDRISSLAVRLLCSYLGELCVLCEISSFLKDRQAQERLDRLNANG